jgi:cell division protein FtsL
VIRKGDHKVIYALLIIAAVAFTVLIIFNP